MAAAVWPSIPAEDLEREEKNALANELAWLLEALHESLAALKSGFEECASLLAPTEWGSTLPLSSHRSESLKGIVTRAGTRIVKGDIKLRLATLAPPKDQAQSQYYPLVISQAPQAPTLLLPQLTGTRTRIDACLDVVDATSWAGDSTNAHFVSGQLRLLDVNIHEAKLALKGSPDAASVRPWFQDPVDPRTFDPPLPENVAFHLSIAEAGLALEVRTLEILHSSGSGGSTASSSSSAAAGGTSSSSDYHSPFDFRGRLAAALGAVAKPQAHDEEGKVFSYKGQHVRVKEKVRVESQDPSLMAAMAKLTALERSVAHARKALDVVMGQDEQ